MPYFIISVITGLRETNCFTSIVIYFTMAPDLFPNNQISLSMQFIGLPGHTDLLHITRTILSLLLFHIFSSSASTFILSYLSYPFSCVTRITYLYCWYTILCPIMCQLQGTLFL